MRTLQQRLAFDYGLTRGEWHRVELTRGSKKVRVLVLVGRRDGVRVARQHKLDGIPVVTVDALRGDHMHLAGYMRHNPADWKGDYLEVSA